MSCSEVCGASESAEARFGIGDVYFLALSMGKCEVIVDEAGRG